MTDVSDVPVDDAPVLAAQPNLRDLGGLRGAGGRRVRPGLVYRSGELCGLDDADRRSLAGLGLATVVDLRSTREVAERGADEVDDGTEVVHLPVDEADGIADLLTARFAAGDLDPPDEDLMAEAYRRMVRHHTPAFRAYVDLLVDGPLPLAVHCTHGKDRAGVAAAIVLLSVGVPWADVEADYLRSNVRRAAQNQAYLDRIAEVAAAMTGRPADELDLGWMTGFFVVEARYLRAARQEAERGWGSLDGWLTDGLGLDDDRRAALAARLLV